MRGAVCLMVPALLASVGMARAQRGGPVAEAVLFVEDKAEDAIDNLLAGDWVDADARVDSISAREHDVLTAMTVAGASAATRDLFTYFVFLLQDAVRRRVDQVGAALVANQITAQMIELRRSATSPAAWSVARMDYLGRELVLLSRVADDRGLLARRIDELTAAWNGVRGVIVEKGAGQLVGRVDDRVQRLQNQPAKGTVERIGSEILDLVDELEAVTG